MQQRGQFSWRQAGGAKSIASRGGELWGWEATTLLEPSYWPVQICSSKMMAATTRTWSRLGLSPPSNLSLLSNLSLPSNLSLLSTSHRDSVLHSKKARQLLTSTEFGQSWPSTIFSIIAKFPGGKSTTRWLRVTRMLRMVGGGSRTGGRRCPQCRRHSSSTLPPSSSPSPSSCWWLSWSAKSGEGEEPLNFQHRPFLCPLHMR